MMLRRARQAGAGIVTPLDLQDKTENFLAHTTARRVKQTPRPKDVAQL
jgi:hypothetical protein